MSRRAFFIIGAEGSGTYMLAEAFQSAGCHWESWHNGIHDDYKFDEMPDLLVFRRSIPHAGQIPQFIEIGAQMQSASYEVVPVFIFREPNATIKSILRRDPSRNPAILSIEIRYGLTEAFEAFKNSNFIWVTYEAFCLDENFRRWLFVERLGLKEPGIEIAYANEKYYMEEQKATPQPEPPQGDTDPSGAPGWPLPKPKGEEQ